MVNVEPEPLCAPSGRSVQETTTAAMAFALQLLIAPRFFPVQTIVPDMACATSSLSSAPATPDSLGLRALISNAQLLASTGGVTQSQAAANAMLVGVAMIVDSKSQCAPVILTSALPIAHSHWTSVGRQPIRAHL